jgi:hypothetical protein
MPRGSAEILKVESGVASVKLNKSIELYKGEPMPLYIREPGAPCRSMTRRLVPIRVAEPGGD